ncbi:MAG TPA: tyrosine-type recombinase/integrase, partial [Longimicrobiales bacterium]|nr:tyrosine-type recombinase/integrase [Longimicrobiales bacterium]
LGRLWTLYEESASFAKLDNSTRHGYRSAARILLASVGADTDVTKLDKEAVTAHRNRRAAGGIRYWRVKHNRHRQAMKDASGKEIVVEVSTPPVRARAVGLDLQVLRVMLNWAVETRGPDGEFLLDHFPIRGGIEIPREQNPVRPFADYERFCLLLQAVQRAAETAEAGGDALAARRFRLLELALVLVEATGRRIGSVRQLRRSDFELNEANGFANARIRWRWTSDKKRRQGLVPIPRELAALLHGLLVRLGVVGEAYVFAQRHTPSKPVSRDELSKWALEAEEAAQLPHLEGGLWHPFRRKWSKERKHLPEIKDVMAAGGWTDIKTFMDSYNEPDFDTMLAVMEAPAKARAEAAAKAAAAAAVRPSEALERMGGASTPSVRKSEATRHPGIRRRPANRAAVADSAVERNDARPAHLRLV